MVKWSVIWVWLKKCFSCGLGVKEVLKDAFKGRSSSIQKKLTNALFIYFGWFCYFFSRELLGKGLPLHKCKENTFGISTFCYCLYVAL